MGEARHHYHFYQRHHQGHFQRLHADPTCSRTRLASQQELWRKESPSCKGAGDDGTTEAGGRYSHDVVSPEGDDDYLQYRELFMTKLALEATAALATFLVTAAAIMMILLQHQGLLTAVIVIALSVPAFVLSTQRLSCLGHDATMFESEPLGDIRL